MHHSSLRLFPFRPSPPENSGGSLSSADERFFLATRASLDRGRKEGGEGGKTKRVRGEKTGRFFGVLVIRDTPHTFPSISARDVRLSSSVLFTSESWLIPGRRGAGCFPSQESTLACLRGHYPAFYPEILTKPPDYVAREDPHVVGKTRRQIPPIYIFMRVIAYVLRIVYTLYIMFNTFSKWLLPL